MKKIKKRRMGTESNAVLRSKRHHNRRIRLEKRKDRMGTATYVGMVACEM